jgi:hypothetical protein
MAKTWKRLFGPAQLTGSAATKYTVPSTTKTIIREIHVINPSSSTVNLTVSIGSDAAGTRIFDAYAIPPSGALDRPFHCIVMDAAEILQAFASSASVLVMTIFGEELTPG